MSARHAYGTLPPSSSDRMTSTDTHAFTAALSGPLDPEIVAMEERLRAAQLAADVAALDALLDEALLFTGPDGALATKAQDLAAHASGAVRFLAHEPEALHIRRVGGDVAVAALRARLTVAVGGELVEGTYRYTRVWAREGGAAVDAWRVVGGHVSAVPSAPGSAGDPT